MTDRDKLKLVMVAIAEIETAINTVSDVQVANAIDAIVQELKKMIK